MRPAGGITGLSRGECCGDDIHIHQTLTGGKCKQAQRPLEKANNQTRPKIWEPQADGTPNTPLKYPVSCYSSEIGVMNFLKSGWSSQHISHMRTGDDLIKSVLFWAKKVKSKIRIQFPQWLLFTFFTAILSPLSSVYNSIFTFVSQENAASEKMLPLWRRTRL